MSTCPAIILEHMLVEDVVGTVVNDVIQSFHRKYGCCIKTVLYLICYWLEAAKDLFSQGIPVAAVSYWFQEGLQSAVNNLQNDEINLDLQNLWDGFHKYTTDTARCTANPCDLSSYQESKEATTESRKEELKANNQPMEKGHGSCDDDDVTWYFPDNKIPDVSQIGSTNIHELTHSLEKTYLSLNNSIYEKDGENDIKLGSGSNGFQMKTEENAIDNINQVPNQVFSSIDQNAQSSDSEFGDCFDDIDFSTQEKTRDFDSVKENNECCSNSMKKIINIAHNPMDDSVDMGRYNMTSTECNNSKLKETTLDEILKVKMQKIKYSSLMRSRHLNYSVVVETDKKEVNDIIPLKEPNSPRQKLCVLSRYSELLQSCWNQKFSSNCDIYMQCFLNNLGGWLSHGNDRVMSLAVQACIKQNLNSCDSYPSFDITRVASICQPGPFWTHSMVADGIIIRVNANTACQIAQLLSSTVNCILVNGSIDPSTSHSGYSKPVESKVVQSQVYSYNSHDIWLDTVCDCFQQLCIGAVICRRKVTPTVKDWCDSNKIIVIEDISYQALLALSEGCQANVANYITECDQDNIAKASIKLWNHTMHGAIEMKNLVSIYPHQLDVPVVQTVVVCHPSDAYCELEEENLWHCMRRLVSALTHRRCLKGAGITEAHIADKLHSDAERKNDHPNDKNHFGSFRATVLDAMSSGLRRFSFQVHQNIIEDHEKSCVDKHVSFKISPEIKSCKTSEYGDINNLCNGCSTKESENDKEIRSSAMCSCYMELDDYRTKVEAWKTACSTVKMLLNLDMEIITSQGIDKGSHNGHNDFVGTSSVITGI